jgi:hypothetical protein
MGNKCRYFLLGNRQPEGRASSSTPSRTGSCTNKRMFVLKSRLDTLPDGYTIVVYYYCTRQTGGQYPKASTMGVGFERDRLGRIRAGIRRFVWDRHTCNNVRQCQYLGIHLMRLAGISLSVSVSADNLPLFRERPLA